VKENQTYDILVKTKENGGVHMRKPKSFRFAEPDLKKLNAVHEYYKKEYETRVEGSNMNDLYKWSEAQTLSVLVRDRYEQLIKEGKIED
jgi:hypothetical protein